MADCPVFVTTRDSCLKTPNFIHLNLILPHYIFLFSPCLCQAQYTSISVYITSHLFCDFLLIFQPETTKIFEGLLEI